MSILYFDICAAIILVTFIFSNISRKMTRGTSNRAFMALVIITLLADVFDLWSVAIDVCGTVINHSPWWLLCGTYTGYFLFHNLTVVVYFFYIIAVSDTWHKLRKNKLLVALVLIPTLIIVLSLIINLYTQDIFYFNKEYHYTRGPHMYILYICAFANMIICLTYLIRYRKLFSRDKFWALFSMLPLELCAVVIQLFYPELLVEMFANTVAISLLSTILQRPEELLDSVTSLGKYDAYAVNMKKNFGNSKHVTVIMINVSNFMSLQKILSFDGSNEMLQKIAYDLNSINKELKAHAEIYYLDSGRFRFVIDEENRVFVENSAKRINDCMKQSKMIGGLELNLITYICVAECPEEIKDFKTLVRLGKIFHEKHAYTGQVMYISDMVRQNDLELTGELDDIIDNAIANKCFQVYYQPIYSTKEKKFVSAEALLRLIDDKYGFISPEIFIPAAEKSGAIHKIGDYVMNEVCRFIGSADFKRTGLEYIEVNLSVAQCMQGRLAERILEVMENHGVPPDKINLEITETAAEYDQDIMMKNINKLYSRGISFSLDDYGTGYSNLERIMTLPLTIVKLDKIFGSADNDSKMCALLQNTINMLKDIDMHILVEGVETEESLNRFTELQCEYIQGYYFSKPVPEEEFVKFVMAENI